jgi:hypothetical protein
LVIDGTPLPIFGKKRGKLKSERLRRDRERRHSSAQGDNGGRFILSAEKGGAGD